MAEALAAMIERQDIGQVVGVLGDGVEALQSVEKLEPDVVLIDVNLPRADGIQVARELSARLPSTGILVMSGVMNTDVIVRALRAGALGFLPKNAKPTDLATAVLRARSGRRYIPDAFADAVTEYLLSGPESGPNISELSDREVEVLRRIAGGMTNREIASELGISVRTVDTHRRNILGKTTARNNADLTRLAIRAGIVDP